MAGLLDPTATTDALGVTWRVGDTFEANWLLSRHHYLGPISSGLLVVVGEVDGEVVAAMVWRRPTSRRLPLWWLELSRWCLTPSAGPNAGSRMHRQAVRLIRELLPTTTTLVSYSDPSHGHTGALYRACNWRWAPTWHRLRTPPTGNGNWGTGQQAVKDRWIFALRDDDRRAKALWIDDPGAVRHWLANATPDELRWARNSLNLAHEVAA